MLCKLIAAPSAGRHRDRARAERFPAGNIARCVPNHVNLRCRELAPMFLFCAGACESPELIPVAVIIGERAKFKKMPDAVVLELETRSTRDISCEQREHHMRPRFQPFKQLEHAGK